MKTVVRIVKSSLSAAVPMAFFRVDLVAGRPLIVVKLRTVKDKELSLRSEVARIRKPCKLEVILCSNGNRPGIETVTFFCDRVDDVRNGAKRRFFGKRIDPKPRRIRNKQHVGLVN